LHIVNVSSTLPPEVLIVRAICSTEFACSHLYIPKEILKLSAIVYTCVHAHGKKCVTTHYASIWNSNDRLIGNCHTDHWQVHAQPNAHPGEAGGGHPGGNSPVLHWCWERRAQIWHSLWYLWGQSHLLLTAIGYQEYYRDAIGSYELVVDILATIRAHKYFMFIQVIVIATA